MTRVLKVAVVGGGVGRVHVHHYQALPDFFEVVEVCDLEEEKAQQIASESKVPNWTTDFNSLCQSNNVDVLDFCTPPYQHYEQIMTALAAGKHVVCEKPLVGSLAQVDQLIETSRVSGKLVMPILQYRFGQGLQKLKRLVDRGIAGHPYLTTVEVAWRRREDYYASPWRGKWETELGGTLLNHAIHYLDMLCYIAGPVRNVFARTASLVNPIEVEDSASVSLEMENGSLASLSATLGSALEIGRLRYCFQNLAADSNLKPYAASDDPWTFTGDSDEINKQIIATLAEFPSGRPVFEEQFANFYAAVRGDEPLAVSLADARNLLEVMTAIYESAQTNRPVSLPIAADHPKYVGWAPARATSIH